MECYELNSFPSKIKMGLITYQEAVNELSSFILKNFRVFNLQKFDEDFRSELVITFLENGVKFLQSYNSEIGDFFSFLYCYINSMVTTKIRSLTQKKMKDTLTISESINTFEEKEYKYSKITHHVSEIPKVPYAYKTSNIEELKKIFSNINNSDKKILVLAMKSSFYLSDIQINRICKIYKIKVEDFYTVIQFFKESLLSKNEKRLKAEERRNFAYYHQKRYNMQINKLQTSDQSEVLITQNLESKKNKHYKNWKNMNKKLEDGYLYLRPTTKSVADMLGICERQVTYYINCAKKEIDNQNSNDNLIS